MENSKDAPGVYVIEQLVDDGIEARTKKGGGCGCLIFILVALLLVLIL
ncbi:hypothetical protein [Alkalibacter saccharofermentans]|uniref:Uncharacterized protein n=1 Tax=Alkalibacter saccharofermentans DSM 14828 TaxID=1120975 RepID=A0A1M4ZRD3_9FIRM|nr:hypothetical protein [Alkalibacter saccharofermentans]SHF20485.1 hypothetical protein SAMN02746064_02115 [Alkalibacter saccharofermentans DSM 14828]